MVAALSEALASRESPKDVRDSPRDQPKVRPAIRRQPSEAKTRGPPPEPPHQKNPMPLVSLQFSYLKAIVNCSLLNLNYIIMNQYQQ